MISSSVHSYEQYSQNFFEYEHRRIITKHYNNPVSLYTNYNISIPTHTNHNIQPFKHQASIEMQTSHKPRPETHQTQTIST